ncbi:MAG TPA: lytic murein transglycosylase [Gaiellaceae bacterium]
MKRFVPLLGAVLMLAVSSTASADTFRVVHPHASGPGPVTFTTSVSAASLDQAQKGPMSFPALRTIWQAAGSTYGIPWEVLAAINKVETDFGRNLGPSSAGAVGWMQFMPSTWARWGVDANGDGVADPDNPTDAIFSAARYLAGCGGQLDITRAIYCYNHATWYVNEVLGLAAAYSQGGGMGLFSVDGLQSRISSVRSQMAASNKQLDTARAHVRKLARTERRFLRAAGKASLLSDQLEANKRAVQLDVRLHAAQGRVARLRGLVDSAANKLSSLQSQANTAPFATGVGLFSAPVASGSYVFPVGGGPQNVSVGTTHHDYPAADIDAPEGSPVYALADASVVRAWPDPSGNCGIGATITTSDGQEWTYCHLSYLSPAVHAGARLAAGASMGLVGQTGDATGPHLHLQLDPTSAYPQDEAWFRGFAGLAFRWQDGPPARGIDGSSSQPLFAVLSQPSVATFPSGSSSVASFSSDVVYFTH